MWVTNICCSFKCCQNRKALCGNKWSCREMTVVYKPRFSKLTQTVSAGWNVHEYFSLIKKNSIISLHTVSPCSHRRNTQIMRKNNWHYSWVRYLPSCHRWTEGKVIELGETIIRSSLLALLQNLITAWGSILGTLFSLVSFMRMTNILLCFH